MRGQVFVCHLAIGILVSIFVRLTLVFSYWIIGGGLSSLFRYLHIQRLEELRRLCLSFSDNFLGDKWQEEYDVQHLPVAEIIFTGEIANGGPEEDLSGWETDLFRRIQQRSSWCWSKPQSGILTIPQEKKLSQFPQGTYFQWTIGLKGLELSPMMRSWWVLQD